MELSDILTTFYDGEKEDARLASRHGAVEFLVTTRYIDRYLKPGDRLLEVGCATGRYSLHYARQGWEVDALDLVESNLEVLRQNALPTDRVRAVQGNALDLSRYPDEAFDVTLVLGPMYHLFAEEDKRLCLREALRVTKPGGLLFVAYCQFDAAMVQTGFLQGMHDYLTENNLLDTRSYLPVSNPAGVFELYRKEQIDKLIRSLDADRLHYVGTDMFTAYYPEKIDQMDDALYGAYVAYTLTICENQNLVGVSNHTLDILRKNTPQ